MGSRYAIALLPDRHQRPEALHADATEALREAYETGMCTMRVFAGVGKRTPSKPNTSSDHEEGAIAALEATKAGRLRWFSAGVVKK